MQKFVLSLASVFDPRKLEKVLEPSVAIIK